MLTLSIVIVVNIPVTTFQFVELKPNWPPIGQEQAASKQCLLACVLMDDLQKLETDCLRGVFFLCLRIGTIF